MAAAQASPQGRARIALVAALADVPGWYDPTTPEPAADNYPARQANQFTAIQRIGLAESAYAKRGYSPEKVELVRRWFNGEFTPKEWYPIFLRIGGAYFHNPSLRVMLGDVIRGGWRAKVRPEAQIFGFRHLLKGWTVMDRLGQVAVPTLVMAGREDFVFPPQCQRELAAGVPNARLRLIERAGHNPHVEQPTEVMQAVSDFISPDIAASATEAPTVRR